jgi:DHA1 family bicyclomycin/chloramphenicol resistance-like MFS transporter
MLIAMRLVQGLGACAGIVVGRAVLRDRLQGAAMTQMLGVVAVALAAAPMIGPTIGGVIEVAYGWRAVFGLLALLAILGVVGVIWVLPETRQPDPTASPGLGPAFRRYGRLVADWRFVGIVLTAGCVTAMAYIYSAGAPLIFIVLLGWSPAEFGLLGVATAGGNFAVSVAIATGALRARATVFVAVGTATVVCATVAFLAISVTGWWVSPLLFVIPIVVASISAALAQVGLAALAMEGQAGGAGAASAVLGMGQMALGAVATSALATQTMSSPVPMAILMVVAACAGFGAMVFSFSVAAPAGRRLV